jgi:hypothetical protein
VPKKVLRGCGTRESFPDGRFRKTKVLKRLGNRLEAEPK